MLIFTCPISKMNVQHRWDDDDDDEDGAPNDGFEGITCLACGQVHFIDKKSGKPLGAKSE